MTRLTTPKHIEPLVATAVKTVEFVTDRIFLVIVLVVILGRVELCCLYNLGNDRFFEGLVLLQQRLRLQRQPVLFLVMIEDCAPILMPMITELPVLNSRVDIVPEDVQELLIGHFCRVIDDLNRLGVPCPSGRDLFVSGILFLPPSVTGCNRNHAGNLVEWVFHAPEAAACEGRFLKISCSHDCGACDKYDRLYHYRNNKHFHCVSSPIRLIAWLPRIAGQLNSYSSAARSVSDHR